MVANFTMRTHGENQAFRFVEGIWLHRKSRQIRKRLGLYYTHATCSEVPSFINTMEVSNCTLRGIIVQKRRHLDKINDE